MHGWNTAASYEDARTPADCSASTGDVDLVETGLGADHETVRDRANQLKLFGGVVQEACGTPDEPSYAYFCPVAPNP